MEEPTPEEKRDAGEAAAKAALAADGRAEQPESVSGFIFDLGKVIVLVLAVVIPFRLLVAEPYVVSGNSMLPNYVNREYLIVDRLSYRFKAPARGDVVVLRYPKDTSQDYIKRIIGLPGESVRFEGGKVVIVNADHPEGFTVEEVYIPGQVPTLGSPEPVKLSDGQYFVLGDNRTSSSDSRTWGILPENDIVGRAFLTVFPVSRASVHHPVDYSTSNNTNG